MANIPSRSNPFRISKAVNLTDQEIAETFVRSPVVADRVSPDTRTPVLLLGGKGSGRTHLCGTGRSRSRSFGQRKVSLARYSEMVISAPTSSWEG